MTDYPELTPEVDKPVCVGNDGDIIELKVVPGHDLQPGDRCCIYGIFGPFDVLNSAADNVVLLRNRGALGWVLPAFNRVIETLRAMAGDRNWASCLPLSQSWRIVDYSIAAIDGGLGATYQLLLEHTELNVSVIFDGAGDVVTWDFSTTDRLPLLAIMRDEYYETAFVELPPPLVPMPPMPAMFRGMSSEPSSDRKRQLIAEGWTDIHKAGDGKWRGFPPKAVMSVEIPKG
jgi:hypothetical protein